jgi:hypothetical protein
MTHTHDFVYWALMIATAGAFAAVIAALVWLYGNSKKNPGDK